MENYALTYRHIADILSFEVSAEQLENTLSDPTFDWDAIVIHGSQHLVLPAIYCRLKRKALLHLVPEELVLYLDELTSINRNRNQTLLKQIHSIAEILNSNHINYVFLKGTALLALGCYEDSGERMMGDIDILVEKSQIDKAQNLLKASGYNKTLNRNFKSKNPRHLPRLISENELAAVELHSELFNKKYWSLMDMTSILKAKQVVNTIALPNKMALSLHNVLNWQLNDFGHYYNAVSLKSIYDLLVLKTHNDPDFISSLMKFKQGQSFLQIAKIYFKDFSTISSNRYMRYRGETYLLSTKNKILNTSIRGLKSFSQFAAKRVKLLFTNPSYTSYILKKLFSKNTP